MKNLFKNQWATLFLSLLCLSFFSCSETTEEQEVNRCNDIRIPEAYIQGSITGNENVKMTKDGDVFTYYVAGFAEDQVTFMISNTMAQDNAKFGANSEAAVAATGTLAKQVDFNGETVCGEVFPAAIDEKVANRNVTITFNPSDFTYKVVFSEFEACADFSKTEVFASVKLMEGDDKLWPMHAIENENGAFELVIENYQGYDLAEMSFKMFNSESGENVSWGAAEGSENELSGDAARVVVKDGEKVCGENIEFGLNKAALVGKKVTITFDVNEETYAITTDEVEPIYQNVYDRIRFGLCNWGRNRGLFGKINGATTEALVDWSPGVYQGNGIWKLEVNDFYIDEPNNILPIAICTKEQYGHDMGEEANMADWKAYANIDEQLTNKILQITGNPGTAGIQMYKKVFERDANSAESTIATQNHPQDLYGTHWDEKIHDGGIGYGNSLIDGIGVNADDKTRWAEKPNFDFTDQTKKNGRNITFYFDIHTGELNFEIVAPNDN